MSPTDDAVTGRPAGWLVAEQRDGRWLFGEDWTRAHDSRPEANYTACEWSRHMSPGDAVGVFALVAVDVYHDPEPEI